MKHPPYLLLRCILLAVLAWPVHAEPRDVFVLAGQSNMQGWQGDGAGYPADPAGLDGQIPFFWVAPGFSDSGRQWTTLRPQPGRFPKGHFGPEVEFARRLRSAGYHPAIFKYSLGSTSLSGHWKGPGDNGMYDRMVTALRDATDRLRRAGDVPNLRALVWIQGESDAETLAQARLYGMRLRQLIDDFRRRVAGNPELPVLLGVDERHPWVQRQPVIVASQQILAEDEPMIGFVSMTGLPKADDTHLTPAGLRLHGDRLAQAYLQLAAGIRPDQPKGTGPAKQ